MADNISTQKVVIVEDNAALNDIYKTRLEILGYRVFSAYDGVQALSVIEHEIPDLVLLDLMVPKKAGDQILEEMRQSEWGKDIKVLIISNLNEVDAPKGLRNLGIEGYAVKANLSNDQLDQLVDVILRPAGQAEDVLLSGSNNEILSDAPHNPEQIPQASTYTSQAPEATVPTPASVAPPVIAEPAPRAPSSPMQEVPVVPEEPKSAEDSAL